MVLDGRGIAQFGFFGDGYEAFDVVPLALDQRSVVRDGIVAVVGRGNTGNDRELAVFGMLLQAGLEVGERRGDREQRDTLEMLRQGFVAPVGEQHERDVAAFVRRRKTAVARLLADKAHYLRAVLVEYQDRDGEREVLEVLTDPEEIGSEVVLKQEVLDVVLHLGGATVGVVLQARAIADFGVELHTGGEGLIILHFGDDVVGHSVIHAPRHEALPAVEDTIVKARVFTEDRAAVGNECHRRLGIGDGFDRGKRKFVQAEDRSRLRIMLRRSRIWQRRRC